MQIPPRFNTFQKMRFELAKEKPDLDMIENHFKHLCEQVHAYTCRHTRGSQNIMSKNWQYSMGSVKICIDLFMINVKSIVSYRVLGQLR